MAKKKPDPAPEPEPIDEPIETEPTEDETADELPAEEGEEGEVATEVEIPKLDLTHIGLHEGGRGDDVAFIAPPKGSFTDDEGRCRERSIRVRGQNYEHVAEDEHDRWIYRRM